MTASLLEHVMHCGSVVCDHLNHLAHKMILEGFAGFYYCEKFQFINMEQLLSL